MWTAVIAVLGTLAGGLANALAQARSERAARREAYAVRLQEWAADHQDSQVAAVESLVKSSTTTVRRWPGAWSGPWAAPRTRRSRRCGT